MASQNMKDKKPRSKSRARLEILNRLFSFPTISNVDWDSRSKPVIGDLVSLNCAPTTKWYLSWVVDKRGDGQTEYLLESVDDASTCWWSNVGFSVYDKDKIRYNWRWTDRQFEFMYRWFRIEKRNNAYMVRCALPEFDGDKVTLRTNIKFNLCEDYDGNPRTFDDWKKLKSSDMDSYYKDSVAKYESRKPASERAPK